MSRIKLLVVTPYFYPKVGGLENYAFNISKGLMKDYNYEIVVITSNHESKEYKEEKLEGMKIYRLPYQFKVSNTPISFKWIWQIRDIIKREQPDIINAHTPVPFIADIACRVAHKLKIPFVLTYHCGSMKKEKAFLKNIIINIYESIILKKTLAYSTKVICCSDFVRLNFLKYCQNKSITITPGVNIEKFKPNGIGSNRDILFIGRFTDGYTLKGLDYLIEAVRLLKDINLVVIGEGISKEIPNIEFKGIKIGDELIKEIQRCGVLVLPSILPESFGTVLIEAMACGKPVIGSNIGGIPYVIDDGVDGLLVPPRDSQALANAIIKLLNNPELAEQMGENGYKNVSENFTWDNSTRKMSELIPRILR